MRDKNSALDDFRNSIGKLGGNIHILEEPVPVEEQMSYFAFSEKVKKGHFRYDVLDMSEYDIMELLTDEEVPLTKKKSILAALAVARSVKQYRILEHYLQLCSSDTRGWTLMALMEARIGLETDLSGEKQVFISSGLGGKKDKMRFYVLFFTKNGQILEPYQYAVVRDEGRFLLEKQGCRLEHISCGEKYVEMLALVPIGADVKVIFSSVITGCNEFGDFLSQTFTVTNVKILGKEEIDAIILKNERND
jgi:hypothetical protein